MGNKPRRETKGDDPKVSPSTLKFDTYSYDIARVIASPGDLVLFAGSDFVSSLIRHLENKLAHVPKRGIAAGAFSHVGIVVTSEILDHPNVHPGKLYVWESTMGGKLGCGVKDVDGNTFFGTQLRDLDELAPRYLKSKKSKIAIGRLIKNPLSGIVDLEDRGYIKEVFTRIFNRYNAIPYDINPFSLLGSALPPLRDVRDASEDVLHTKRWMFCSEMVAQVYKDLGVLPGSLDARDVIPMDFLGYDTDNIVPVIIQPTLLLIDRNSLSSLASSALASGRLKRSE